RSTQNSQNTQPETTQPRPLSADSAGSALSVVSSSRRLGSRGQAALERELHRRVDRDADDAGVAVDPAVRRQGLLLARAQVGEVLARVGLQPRLGGPAVAPC